MLNGLVSNGVKVEDTANLPLDKWSYIAVTWDGSALRLYVNGGIIDTNNTLGNINWATTGPFTLSAAGSSGA